MSEKPRGLRNKNPGNLRHSATHWMGQDDNQMDSDFVTFTDAKYGIRALYKTLRTYQMKHGLNTVRAMINRWAPPNENDTGSYVNAVAAQCKVGPDDIVDIVENKPLASSMVAAIIHHENGIQPYSTKEIRDAMDMA